ncbi:MAG: hypothetical protein LJE93_10010 [Acidobacteria bacterium]|jgi:hypothetical protein|nr:hypothetical protein [Acidobacteriota bacterium]
MIGRKNSRRFSFGWSMSLAATMNLALISGCSSVGPPALDRDRLDYSNAITSSWQRQMLLNIVKLRYGDTPFFLEVSSVINQYTVEASGGIGVTPGGRQDDNSIGVGGSYTDRPTVTYAPLAGEAFSQRLLTPVSPVSLFALVQAGWPVDFIFRICVRKINGVANTSSGFLPTDEDPEFEKLIAALLKLQQSGQMSLKFVDGGRVQAADEDSAVVLIIGEPSAELESELEYISHTLGLSRPFGSFTITYGGAASEPNEIAVLSRSALEILMELSYTIDIPEEDIASGRAKVSRYHDGSSSSTPPITIVASKSRPESALVAVEYRGTWYSIDDRDIMSKYTLTFMLILLNLSESGASGMGPVMTLGAGG